MSDGLRYFIVSMETLNETQHRVLANDPKDAEQRVRAGEGQLVESLDGEGNLTDVTEDEDQDDDES